MKKIIAFLLVVVMITPLCETAFAQYDEEITFRDIPFGTQYSEVIERLKQEGLEFKEPISVNEIYRVESSNTISVAGSDMSVHLFFMSMESNEAPIEECVLYNAKYLTDSGELTSDNIVVYGYSGYNKWLKYSKELREKLESIYGPADKHVEKDSDKNGAYSAYDHYYGKDTMILYDVAYSPSYYQFSINILYRWTKGEERLSEYHQKREEQKKEERIASNGGTSGL